MQSRPKNLTAIVIGAGPAGLFAARELKRQGIDKIVILEKEPRVGGKCCTYQEEVIVSTESKRESKVHESKKEMIKTELGATLISPAASYDILIEAIDEKKIEFEDTIPTAIENIPLYQAIAEKSGIEKDSYFADLAIQIIRFNGVVNAYQKRNANKQKLPPDFELPFADFANKYQLQKINTFLIPFVTGFGYGLMSACPAYAIFEYMGKVTIPDILLLQGLLQHPKALLAIKGGFQHVMEEVAKDFYVITSAQITQIDRSEKDGVRVTYKKDLKTETLSANLLVLAISPLYWPKLGMRLNKIEQECASKLSYYRYPVAACKITGMPAQNIYMDLKDTGHLSLVTTSDARKHPEGGRLATIYINLKPGPDPFTFDEKTLEMLKKEILEKVPGARDVTFIEPKIWEDYMSTLPWDTRIALDNEQLRPDVRTMYVGPYALGGFEDVGCVTTEATRAVREHVGKKQFKLTLCQEVKDAAYFFESKTAAPVGEEKVADRRCCVIL